MSDKGGASKGVLWRDPIRSPANTPPTSPISPVTAAKGQGLGQEKDQAQEQGLSKKKKMEKEEAEEEDEDNEVEEEEDDDEWQPDPRRPSDQVVSRIATVAATALNDESKANAPSLDAKNKKKTTNKSGQLL